MRIVIDMQGAQSASRDRGIGRYTKAITEAIVRNRGDHDVFVALSALFPDTIEPIRRSLSHVLARDRVRVWSAPGPTMEADPANDGRRASAKTLREAFIASLQPDVVFLASPMEGYGDDVVVSIGEFDDRAPVVTTMFDLIPLLNPKEYLDPYPRFQRHYLDALDTLRRADHVLAISHSSRREAIDHLDLSPLKVTAAPLAVDGRFRPLAIEPRIAEAIRSRFMISSAPFVLYTGASDERKNLPRLIKAFAALSEPTRSEHRLVLAGGMSAADVKALSHLSRSVGLTKQQVCFTGRVTDDDLITLYNLCELYVFPSWHEGFGLPALEAMACGAAVIGSNRSSVPEVIGFDNALFDPFDIASIGRKMEDALSNASFRAQLIEQGRQRAALFSWDATARMAISVFERVQAERVARETVHFGQDRLLSVIDSVASLAPRSNGETLWLASCISQNELGGDGRRIFLDVSELVRGGAGVDVQKAVSGWVRSILLNPRPDLQVVPVSAESNAAYVYAESYSSSLLGDDRPRLDQRPVHWRPEDILICLDTDCRRNLARITDLQQLRMAGVRVRAVLWACGCNEDTCEAGTVAACDEWHRAASMLDGAVYASTISAGRCQAVPHDPTRMSLDQLSLTRAPAHPVGRRPGKPGSRRQRDRDESYGSGESSADGRSTSQTALDDALSRSVADVSPRRRILIDVSNMLDDADRSCTDLAHMAMFDVWSRADTRYVRIEPVYLTDDGFRYARTFSELRLNRPSWGLQDEAVEITPETVFLGLSPRRSADTAYMRHLTKMRRYGVRVLLVLQEPPPPAGAEVADRALLIAQSPWSAVAADGDELIVLTSEERAHGAGGTRSSSFPNRTDLHRIPLGMPLIARGILDSGTSAGGHMGTELARRPTLVAHMHADLGCTASELIAAVQLVQASGRDLNLVMIGDLHAHGFPEEAEPPIASSIRNRVFTSRDGVPAALAVRSSPAVGFMGAPSNPEACALLNWASQNGFTSFTPEALGVTPSNSGHPHFTFRSQADGATNVVTKWLSELEHQTSTSAASQSDAVTSLVDTALRTLEICLSDCRTS